jgi:hypothetical protein
MGCGGRGSVERVMCSQGGSPVSEQRRARRTALMRTAKPCGPDTRCWCQAVGGEIASYRKRSAIKPAVTVTRRIRRRGERGISRKAIAQGMPECSDCTCMLVCVSLRTFAHETAGAACTRHSLLPLFGGTRFSANLGRIAPRERGVICGESHCVAHPSRRRFAPPQDEV